MDGYPVGLVLNLHRAARFNRRLAALDLATGVSLGIRDALSKDGPLVKAWLKNANEAEPAATQPKSDKLPPWLQGLPVVVKKRDNG